MKISNFEVGKKVIIIAEIGNNHNGDFQIAKRLIKEAANCGADGVKFQTYNPDLYVLKTMPVVAHAKGEFKTQHERLTNLALSKEQYLELKEFAKENDLMFSSTPFDDESVDFLENLIDFYKISSGDNTNIPLIKKIAEKGKPVVLSTGMASMQDIQKALCYFSRENIVLLHCVAKYPVPMNETNLLSILYLKEKLGIPIGYSDHSIGLTACEIATALGAVMIEKHFTLDKSQSAGDHKLSAEPADFAALVDKIRNIEDALGVYGLSIKNQIETAKILRRSLYARVGIPKGSIITEDMVVALRPPGGISSADKEFVVGKITKIDILKDTKLSWDMLA